MTEMDLMRAVVEAARRMPRTTPNPGSAFMLHDYKIAGGDVWQLDQALRRLDAFNSPPERIKREAQVDRSKCIF